MIEDQNGQDYVKKSYSSQMEKTTEQHQNESGDTGKQNQSDDHSRRAGQEQEGEK